MDGQRRRNRARRTAIHGSDVRRQNAASILATLRDRGPLPRVELAAALELSSAGVTRLTAELVESGMLRELEPITSVEVGRRRVPVDLAAESFVAAGAHIGFQWTMIGLVDLRGRLVAGPKVLAHHGTDPATIIGQAVDEVTALVTRRPAGAQLIGVGVSSGASVQRESGVVTDHAVLGWHDVDVAGMVGDRLGPALAVESTYRAMAIAEMWFGAGRDVSSLVHLFLGHAIGAAMVINGALHDGLNLRAGNIAHLPVTHKARQPCQCGRSGCLTSVASPQATLERAAQAGLAELTSIREITDLATEGEPRAEAVLRERAESIGEAVCLLVETLAPERVVLGGSALLRPTDLATILEVITARLTYQADVGSIVVPTELGTWEVANVVASAIPALQMFYDDPIQHMSYLAGVTHR